MGILNLVGLIPIFLIGAFIVSTRSKNMQYKWKNNKWLLMLFLYWLITTVGCSVLFTGTGINSKIIQAKFTADPTDPAVVWVVTGELIFIHLVALPFILLPFFSDRSWSKKEKLLWIPLSIVIKLVCYVTIGSLIMDQAPRTKGFLAARGVQVFHLVPLIIYSMRRSTYFVIEKSANDHLIANQKKMDVTGGLKVFFYTIFWWIFFIVLARLVLFGFSFGVRGIIKAVEGGFTLGTFFGTLIGTFKAIRYWTKGDPEGSTLEDKDDIKIPKALHTPDQKIETDSTDLGNDVILEIVREFPTKTSQEIQDIIATRYHKKINRKTILEIKRQDKES